MISARHLSIGVLLVALLLTPSLVGQEVTKAKGPAPGEVEVRFADNSALKVKLKEQRVNVVTPYGKLSIPVADIQKVEFATRLPEDMSKRIDKAIADLESTDFSVRETATKELQKLGIRAYPALLEAARSKDPEVARRAEDLAHKLRASVSEEQLTFRKQDVIQTQDMRFAGKIEGDALKGDSLAFGEVQLKLVDLRAMRSLALAPEMEVVKADPDPGTLSQLGNQVGKRFAFRVTGTVDGSVWGTDVYTTDSQLSTAAVHAGVVKPGQTGVVKVMIVAPPPGFAGSARNGVTTYDYGAYPAAYQIVK